METMTIIKLALFFVSALLLGYLAYRGTRWHLSYLDLEDQLSGFQDKYWSTNSTCPTTGEVCVNTKCAPAILRLYFQSKTRLVDAFGALPPNVSSLFSFGAYWFASSAAAIILAFRWFENLPMQPCRLFCVWYCLVFVHRRRNCRSLFRRKSPAWTILKDLKV